MGVSPSELVSKKSPGVVSPDTNSGRSNHQLPVEIHSNGAVIEHWQDWRVDVSTYRSSAAAEKTFLDPRGDGKSPGPATPVLFSPSLAD